jgi:hypothetical protein
MLANLVSKAKQVLIDMSIKSISSIIDVDEVHSMDALLLIKIRKKM